jgi:hypothetical protein
MTLVEGHTHKATQTGLGAPSPLDRWINALLRGLGDADGKRRETIGLQTQEPDCRA